VPRHSQLISKLRAGELQYKTTEGAMASLFVSGGVLEVQPHVVTILADTGMRAEDLDEAAAREAMKQATDALQGAKTRKTSIMRRSRLSWSQRRRRSKCCTGLVKLAVTEFRRVRNTKKLPSGGFFYGTIFSLNKK